MKGESRLKKKYKLLLILFGVELAIAYIMNGNGVKFNSFWASAIGTLIFLLPLQILLFCVYKDHDFKEKTRKFSIIGFWFINVCYIAGGVAKLMQ